MARCIGLLAARRPITGPAPPPPTLLIRARKVNNQNVRQT